MRSQSQHKKRPQTFTVRGPTSNSEYSRQQASMRSTLYGEYSRQQASMGPTTSYNDYSRQQASMQPSTSYNDYSRQQASNRPNEYEYSRLQNSIRPSSYGDYSRQQAPARSNTSYNQYPRPPPPIISQTPCSEYSYYDSYSVHNSSQRTITMPSTVIEECKYKNYLCPACKEHYDCTNRNNHFIGKVPLILSCQHTVCQDCIKKRLVKDSVVCPVCEKLSVVPVKNNLQDVFPPNFYILGLIIFYRPQSKFHNINNLGLVASNQAKKKSLEANAALRSINEICCFKSCQKDAQMRCKDCNDIFCVECCTDIHSSANKLMDHKPEPISKKLDLEKCPEHGAMFLEFFCKTCETAACCYCLLEKHEGHERESLSKLCAAEMVELNALKENAQKVFKQLLVTQKKLKNLCNYSTDSVDKKICSYFVDFHAQLYSIEKELREEAANYKTSTSGLAGISSSVTASINQLKTLLAHDNVKNTKKVNLRLLLEKLKELKNVPSYLLTGDSSGSTDPVKFVASTSLSNLKSHFAIENSEDSDYLLVTGDQLPLNYEYDELDSSDDETISEMLNTTESSLKSVQVLKRSPSVASCVSVKSEASEKLSARQTGNKKSRTNFDIEKVVVTYIKSMECFYIQYKKMQGKLFQLSKEIQNYLKLGGQSVKHPQINELYLAMYTSKNEQQWCRGRVTEIKNGEKEPLYEVFFIDYGHSQSLSAGRLKEITPFLSQKKPFAFECQLYNPTFVSWSKNAHITLGKIINGKELFMLVKKQNNGIYEVDLMISSSDGATTSVIDILVHACKNVLSSSEDSINSSGTLSAKKDTFYPRLKVYSNSRKFEKNQKENIVIANIIDPHNIFVHMAVHVDALRKMNAAMKKFYRNAKNESCVPVEGTYVVVEYKDPVRGNWHRTLIKKVDTNCSKAHVVLVDWGLNVVVNWSQIRMLHEPFTKLESQAILVKLAHIEPYDKQDTWSVNAIQYLKSYFISQENLRMVVHNVKPDLEVALFDIVGSTDICLNAKMVQDNLADSTGPVSTLVEWPQFQPQEVCYSEEDGFVGSLIQKVFDESILESEDEDDASNVVKRQVDIVKVVDPDLIYIKFTIYHEREQSLFKDLQIHYSEVQPTKETWKVDEMCVLVHKKAYVRGKITEKLADGTYKIYLADKAEDVVMPQEKIYTYDKYFTKYPQVVVKCHLVNIRPAGDTGKWSNSSIEALQKMFEKHKNIYVAKVIDSDDTKKSLPVDMWYAQIKIGGALEPNRTKYISINNSLIRLGFAYKQLNVNKTFVKEEVTVVPTEEFENTTIVDEALNDLNKNTSSEASEKSKDKDKSLKKDVKSDIIEEKEEQDTEKANSSVEESSREEEKVVKSVDTESSDWNDIVEEETAEKNPDEQKDSPYHTREISISDWLAPLRLIQREFNAWVTCAETGGFLFLHDEAVNKTYKDMQTCLKEYFDNNPPIKEKHNWEAGQLCTIAYEDGNWYRGRVLDVKSPNEVTVYMIDYGSDHVISPDKLHRQILYPDVPAFATKCKLYKVYPKSGAWLSSDYDALLEMLSEYCRVRVEGPLEVDMPYIHLYTDKGVYVNQKITEVCPNLTRCALLPAAAVDHDENSVLIEKEEMVSPISPKAALSFYKDFEIELVDTTKRKYLEEPLPESFFITKQYMAIVGILSYNTVVLKHPKEIISEDFYLMTEDIQNSVDFILPIEEKDIEEGVPCVCPYEEDGVWYRAKIHNTKQLGAGYVIVFFVDYGNTQVVAIRDLRMMKEDWFDLPMQCYIAKLNITLKAEDHLEHVLQYMNKLNGKKRVIDVVKESPLTINLRDNETNDGYCYQSLIDHGLLEVVEQ